MDPQVNQYGRNMVMTNVNRPSKRKYINIDTQYKDSFGPSLANSNISIPERLTNVRSIMVCNAEIPNTFYNISANLGNNYFARVHSSNTTVYTVADGYYTISSLITALNNSAGGSGLTFAHNTLTNKTSISTIISNVKVLFNIDASGKTDTNNYRGKLGWALGFRSTEYYSPTVLNSVISEKAAILDSRYLYLVVDEFSSAYPNSFISPIVDGFLSKNILARISLDYIHYPYGDTIVANNFNGLLLSDVRSYNGTIDIQRLNVRLVDDKGLDIDLNGGDFSFCLQVDHE
jgi:hypothetical protein